MKTLTAVLSLAIALTLAGPAAATQIFTVTSPSGVVHGATEAELAFWTTVGERSGAPPRVARDTAFMVLVDYAWLRSEAAERGVVATRDEAAHVVERARREFPSQRAFRRFLRQTGLTVAALRFAVRHELMSEAIRKAVIAPARAGVTDAAVDAYLAEHGPMVLPERRDLRLVWTATRRKAVAAKRELLGGATWRAVTLRHSIGPPGGVLPDMSRDELERGLAGPVFRAVPRHVRGPVETESGFYVFRVTRVHPPRELPPQVSRRAARRELVTQAQMAALEQFAREYDAKWQNRTTCAPAYAGHPRCGLTRDPRAQATVHPPRVMRVLSRGGVLGGACARPAARARAAC